MTSCLKLPEDAWSSKTDPGVRNLTSVLYLETKDAEKQMSESCNTNLIPLELVLGLSSSILTNWSRHLGDH